ncbi:MAG: hypothetical protein ABI612_07280 [Betaproteobacteria bacterium]
MSLPLVLAGPILRRVEPKLVSVWLALSRPANVTITLWEGRIKPTASGEFFRSNPATPTLRIADNLHITVALLRIPADSQKVLKPNVIYSYDVSIVDGANTHTLASLGLLKNIPTASGGPAGSERPHLALGYIDDFLPSFALPPDKLEDLRIIYGSCRRPVNEHPDAMAMIDDLIIADLQKPLYEDALKRPHQLVLGGDQIYADDVWAGHMVMLNPLANELIGAYKDPQSPHPDELIPLETLPVDRKDLVVSHQEDPINHPDGWAPGGPTHIPCGLVPFPAGRRKFQILRVAQMTTTDGESHLYAFGEFAVLYLMVWSNACWRPPTEWPQAKDVYAPPGPQGIVTPAPEYELPKKWDALTADDVGEKPGAKYKDCADQEGAALDACVLLQRQKKLEARYAIKIEQMTAFYNALPKVRRTLANVPTYMIMDDHDATDDWNLNPIWVERVNKTTFGRAILRNALASYAVFQDWGNDPVRYLSEDTAAAGDPKRMLDTIAKMFPVRANPTAKPATADVPAKAVTDALDKFYGLDQLPKAQLTGGYDPVAPPIKWHWSYKGPKYLLVALDNRTRRSFVSREGPPGNVAISAQKDMIPDTLPAGLDVLIVVAPLQVLGAGFLDELIAPTAYRVFDAAKYSKLNPTPSKEEKDAERKGPGTRRMVGTDPDAIEAWAFDPLALEALLKRLAAHKRVVLLSGDVHYASANEMSYWTKGNPVPARIVQFTGSGFKNVMPWFIGAVDRVLSFAQRMVRSNVGAERMGWNSADGKAFVFKGGHSLADTPPVLRRKLRASPMLMPTFGWPEGTTVDGTKLPDWSWRMKPTLDVRPNSQRPPPGQLRNLDPPETRVQSILVNHAEPGKELMAYATIAARHMDQFDKLRHSRQILFRSNFALVRFERGTDLTAVHEVYTTLADPNAAPGAPLQVLPYLVQRASLDGHAEEVRPELAPLQPPAF